MGPIGMQEMIAIFVLALLLFGPKKLPELGRLLGKGLSEFRRAKNELKNTFETHMHELEREARLHDLQSSNTPDASASRYTYPYEEYKNTYESSVASAYTPSYEGGEIASSTPAASAQQMEARQDAVEGSVPADTIPRNNGVQPVNAAAETQNPV